jgi:hypothetical protein
LDLLNARPAARLPTACAFGPAPAVIAAIADHAVNAGNAGNGNLGGATLQFGQFVLEIRNPHFQRFLS